jgi:undecaprenyl-diphosphatase
MFAATCKSMVDFFTEEGGSFHQDQLVLLLVGNLVAFIVAMMAIRSFIGYLNQHGFKVFGYYRIVVGTILLLCWALGFFEGVTVGNF